MSIYNRQLEGMASVGQIQKEVLNAVNGDNLSSIGLNCCKNEHTDIKAEVQGLGTSAPCFR